MTRPRRTPGAATAVGDTGRIVGAQLLTLPLRSSNIGTVSSACSAACLLCLFLIGCGAEVGAEDMETDDARAPDQAQNDAGMPKQPEFVCERTLREAGAVMGLIEQDPMATAGPECDVEAAATHLWVDVLGPGRAGGNARLVSESVLEIPNEMCVERVLRFLSSGGGARVALRLGASDEIHIVEQSGLSNGASRFRFGQYYNATWVVDTVGYVEMSGMAEVLSLHASVFPCANPAEPQAERVAEGDARELARADLIRRSTSDPWWMGQDPFVEYSSRVVLPLYLFDPGATGSRYAWQVTMRPRSGRAGYQDVYVDEIDGTILGFEEHAKTQ